MSTFNHLELEYLIAAVSSKFQNAQDHHRSADYPLNWPLVLTNLETDVVCVIREWAAAEQPARSGK